MANDFTYNYSTRERPCKTYHRNHTRYEYETQHVHIVAFCFACVCVCALIQTSFCRNHCHTNIALFILLANIGIVEGILFIYS